MTGRPTGPPAPIPADLLRLEWENRGAAAIALLRQRDPSAYLRLISRVIRAETPARQSL